MQLESELFSVRQVVLVYAVSVTAGGADDKDTSVLTSSVFCDGTAQFCMKF